MLVLVTGGSGSGKSAFAEDRVLSFGEKKRIYIATMHPFDQESIKRVQRHRKMRAGKGFETVECYTGLKNVSVPEDSVVLLECMSNLTANEMFEEQGAHGDTVDEILKGISHLCEQASHVVIVTNEIFSDALSFDQEMETYLKYLGNINQKLAEKADEAVEVVYGIPVYIKGGKNSEIIME
ncbi:MAG: bifunctional adenosylcobinamide kinase/adenosylcobinamide-phosphate guanylyltransferase [Clostridia bacterium]|nr:bifunctional adenosylcobinamide kinase/adenosylcobinamide-phosphate guanylyltransferase [Clostridia bacterium]MDY5555908.1 bifunctional adenosylcobinamide kinase/adenosylcobinamide-phosphate guanylyltransferase [Blautia sp.]